VEIIGPEDIDKAFDRVVKKGHFSPIPTDFRRKS
jgi:hypothetical protein